MGAAAIPIGLMLAGAATKAISTNRLAKKQDKAVAEGIRRQGETQRQANARLNETLKFYEDSESGDIRDKLSERYTNQIRLKQNQALSGLNTPGGGSEAYDEKGKKVSGQVLGRADVLQDLFSRIDAPTDQRVGEGYERSDLSSALSVFARDSAAEDYLTRMRVNSKQRSPWLDIISAGLTGAGSGLSGGIGSTAGTATTGATIAGSGGQTPQYFFNPNNPRPPGLNPTLGSIFGDSIIGGQNPQNFYRNRLGP